ncbi:MAG: lysine 5,6-aminomutase subunit alpha, partial [Candidatus Baltobacteraceae bacterium]
MDLRIDFAGVDRCRRLASAIVEPVEEFIAAHSTVSVERSVLRLLGVDGVTPDDVPLPNAVVDSLSTEDRSRGVALAFGRALAETGLDPAALGEAIAQGRYRVAEFGETPEQAARG